MKKIVFSILLWVFALSPMFAQRSELGGLVGGSFYLGDLNPSGLFSQTQLAVGGVYRYNLSTRWALRGNVLWGTITADDAKHDNPRDLSFRSRIGEFSVQAEINFLPYFTGSRSAYRFTPYLFGGVGLFVFDPQAYYFDPRTQKAGWESLWKLSTEGQGLQSSRPDTVVYSEKSYNTAQLSFPFGIGFKYSLNSTFCIGIEWGMRLTFTDYLDDVSGSYPILTDLSSQVNLTAADLSCKHKDGIQPPGSARGSSNKRDWYSFAGITLTAKVGNLRKKSCPAYKTSAMDRIKRDMGDL
jgi:hypothetical protein